MSEQQPVIQQDINKWNRNDFTVMERRLSRFIPSIRFYQISSEDFLLKIYPFKELLPNDLVNNILAYHEKCDNKGATIVIAKVTNSEQIIGGYNPLQWDSSNSWKSTNDSFIFSFTNRTNLQSAKVGYSKGGQYSIYGGLVYGPTFGGGHDLYCNNHGTWYSTSDSTYSSYFKIDIQQKFDA